MNFEPATLIFNSVSLQRKPLQIHDYTLLFDLPDFPDMPLLSYQLKDGLQSSERITLTLKQYRQAKLLATRRGDHIVNITRGALRYLDKSVKELQFDPQRDRRSDPRDILVVARHILVPAPMIIGGSRWEIEHDQPHSLGIRYKDFTMPSWTGHRHIFRVPGATSDVCDILFKQSEDTGIISLTPNRINAVRRRLGLDKASP